MKVDNFVSNVFLRENVHKYFQEEKVVEIRDRKKGLVEESETLFW